ncbi:Cysteine ase [Pyrenophora seminiperda CCB06]|uniref:Cysteine ase n=1 Tax=Pyrenophora seminiperda CCB06 TaxID=1302712 RepID=A0A3M7M9Z4_9PLEO|nr:Cysteine ase [Pyrenophora seminiperda CCB06]
MSPYLHDAVAHRSKRVRFSNEPSSPSASSESALASTNAADDTTTNPSDLGTSDSDSELSESSEEPSSDESSSEEEDDDDDEDTEMEESEGQNGVVNLRANRGKKPVMKLGDEDLGPDIRDFLKHFLPQLKAANDELEAQKKAGTLQSLDAGPESEGEPYIEMNLGLGVLEEKDPNASSDSDSASDTEDGSEEKDVLGKLMGREKKKKQHPAAIEVVQETTL